MFIAFIKTYIVSIVLMLLSIIIACYDYYIIQNQEGQGLFTYISMGIFMLGFFIGLFNLKTQSK